MATREMYWGEQKLRLCFDGTYITNHLLTEKSKLPNLRYSESLIQKGDFSVVQDLRNCYFHCQLHKSDYGKVCFAFPKENSPQCMEYDFYIVKVMIYGLKLASLVIHILTKPLYEK